jgi:hypothetical protein
MCFMLSVNIAKSSAYAVVGHVDMNMLK